MPSDEPKRNYNRTPISNYEGYKRLDQSLERLAGEASARDKCCDICHKRTRAWRMVPATFGVHFKTKANDPRAFRGKFVLCCDNGPTACAMTMERAGVAREGMREQAAIDRLGSLGIVIAS